jgi:hypothetical protein
MNRRLHESARKDVPPWLSSHRRTRLPPVGSSSSSASLPSSLHTPVSLLPPNMQATYPLGKVERPRLGKATVRPLQPLVLQRSACPRGRLTNRSVVTWLWCRVFGVRPAFRVIAAVDRRGWVSVGTDGLGGRKPRTEIRRTEHRLSLTASRRTGCQRMPVTSSWPLRELHVPSQGVSSVAQGFESPGDR